MRVSLALAAALLLPLPAPPPASAAVVYEELSNLDDLPIDPPYPVLPLAAGTSSVLGGTSFSADAVDSFAVSVPPGLTLESIVYVYTISAFIRGSGSLTEAISGFALATGDGTAPQPGSLLANENVDMLPGLCSPFVTPCGPESESAVSVPLFEGTFPLPDGVYAFEQRALTANDPGFVNWTSRYRVDLVVPAPAAWGCQGVALAAVAGLARARRRGARGRAQRAASRNR
jgi:hypothetical protein